MYDDDVLAGVPLPGFAIFDALLSADTAAVSRRGSLAASDNDDSSISPIARIRLWRKRGIYIAAALLTFAALLRLTARSRNIDGVPTTDAAQRWQRPASGPSVYTRAVPGWLSQSKSRQKAAQSHQIRHTDLLFNSTAYLDPKRLKADAKRLATLRTLVQAKKSAFDARHFLTLPSKSQIGHTPSADHADMTLTAILLHSPDYDISTTQLIVSLVIKYPFVREIIVWNNDISLHINADVSNGRIACWKEMS